MKDVYNIETSEKTVNQSDLLLKMAQHFSSSVQARSQGLLEASSPFYTMACDAVEDDAQREQCHKAALTLL